MLINKRRIPVIAILTIGFLPSFLKKIIYRLKGYKIGKNVSISIGSVIIGESVSVADGVSIGFMTVIRGKKVEIERFAKIGSLTFIDSGDIRIGEDARINELVIIGGMKTPQSSLDLGARTIIMEYSYINTTMPIKIGDDTGIGGHCLLFTHGSWLNQLEGYPVTFQPITLGDNVWLPWRVFVMPGVEIGDNVVVGANSLINKSVEANSLIAGSPAKVIKEDFPPAVSDQQKHTYFNEYLDNFIEYLQFNDLNIEKDKCENEILVTGSANQSTFKLQVVFDDVHHLPSLGKNSLIVTNITEQINKLPDKADENVMYVDVINKERLGSSDVGEEFAKFVSRYGLRFSRLD